MTHGQDAAGQESSSRPVEMPAVKTTIVGGRPPGCGKMLGEIPRGIEVLVKKASVDPAFRALLLARRSAAADEIGLVLAPAEAIMLDHVPRAQLEAIISRTKVDPSRHNAFLSKAAGVMLAALGASTGLDCTTYSAGVRPRDPNVPAATAPSAQPASKPATEPTSRGVRPDRPVLRGAAGDNVLAAADGPPPPPPAPGRPVMRVAGLMAVPPAPPPDSAPAQTQPADPSTSPGSAQPAAAGGAGVRPTPVQVSTGIRPAPVPTPNPATQPTTASTSRPSSTQASQPALSSKEFDALVKQLDDDNYTVREAAQKKLQEQGIGILPALREALGGDKLSAEVRSRLESVANTLAATTKPAEPKRPEIRVIAGLMIE